MFQRYVGTLFRNMRVCHRWNNPKHVVIGLDEKIPCQPMSAFNFNSVERERERDERERARERKERKRES